MGGGLGLGGAGWNDKEESINMDLVGVPEECDLMKDEHLKSIVCSLMNRGPDDDD